MKPFTSFLKYQSPVFLWSLTIFGLSTIRHLPVVHFPFQVDKTVHIMLYGVLSLFAWRAFYYQSRYPWLKRWALLAAFLFCCLYGVSDEFHQYFVPGRSADVYDVLADATGALIVVSLLWIRSVKSDET